MTLPFAIPLLETSRLTLREPQPIDSVVLGDFFQSPRSAGIGGPWPREDAWFAVLETIGHWALYGYGLWSLTRRDDGAFVGRVGILNHEGWDEPELAWHLFDGFEGSGYALEAALAARKHANRKLGLGPLISYVEPTNTRSKALAERLGARFERDGALQGMPLQVYRHPVDMGGGA
ncbi:MAG: N-acetyltransferase [Cereibacter sphaeroides]|uniref:N-acetyltransferase n=1 Tax=Cereibacter sphaeroides TaxID=1063 RepID=A0A2W5S0Z8_CERSP|nr:MAG: N-acetyltransferase [Cereibacter sphaeroides]